MSAGYTYTNPTICFRFQHMNVSVSSVLIVLCFDKTQKTICPNSCHLMLVMYTCIFVKLKGICGMRTGNAVGLYLYWKSKTKRMLVPWTSATGIKLSRTASIPDAFSCSERCRTKRLHQKMRIEKLLEETFVQGNRTFEYYLKRTSVISDLQKIAARLPRTFIYRNRTSIC